MNTKKIGSKLTASLVVALFLLSFLSVFSFSVVSANTGSNGVANVYVYNNGVLQASKNIALVNGTSGLVIANGTTNSVGLITFNNIAYTDTSYQFYAYEYGTAWATPYYWVTSSSPVEMDIFEGQHFQGLAYFSDANNDNSIHLIIYDLTAGTFTSGYGTIQLQYTKNDTLQYTAAATNGGVFNHTELYNGFTSWNYTTNPFAHIETSNNVYVTTYFLSSGGQSMAQLSTVGNNQNTLVLISDLTTGTSSSGSGYAQLLFNSTDTLQFSAVRAGVTFTNFTGLGSTAYYSTITPYTISNVASAVSLYAYFANDVYVSILPTSTSSTNTLPGTGPLVWLVAQLTAFRIDGLSLTLCICGSIVTFLAAYLILRNLKLWMLGLITLIAGFAISIYGEPSILGLAIWFIVLAGTALWVVIGGKGHTSGK